MSESNDKLVRDKFRLIWPSQLVSPAELIKSQKDQWKVANLKFIKSPLASKFVLQVVGTWAYILARIFNRTRVLNRETYERQLRINELNSTTDRHPPFNSHGPLLTISNHISCIDDPVLWGALLPVDYYSRKHDFVRWSAAAREICFTNWWHSMVFALGKTFPIDRGHGINQPAMEFALELLRHDQWLHFFPEGKVMRNHENQPITNIDRGYKFKWGISKLIIDYLCLNRTNDKKPERIIRVLPFYHLGLDKILPLGRPYVPRFGNDITIYFRPETIDLSIRKLEGILGKPVKILNVRNKNETYIDDSDRIKLTEYFESEMEILQSKAMEHHNSEGN